MKEYTGGNALTCAISKRTTSSALARELGLPLKEDSDTNVGKSFEKEAKEDLISLGYEVRRMSTGFPYDLLVDDCVKIDVKASRLYYGKAGNFYSFNLEKPYCTCDIYILKTLDDNFHSTDTYIIPSKFVATNTQISIGEINSKYHRFRDKWDYVKEYVEFMRSVA